jgi:hypothetical protein
MLCSSVAIALALLTVVIRDVLVDHGRVVRAVEHHAPSGPSGVTAAIDEGTDVRGNTHRLHAADVLDP